MGTTTNTEAWAQRIAENILSDERAKATANERLADEHRLRRQLVPKLWHELRENLIERCKAINEAAGREIAVFEVWPNTEASIRTTDKPRRLRVEFNADAQRVYYECGSGKGEYLFRLNEDTSVVFVTPYHLPFTAAEVGESLMEKLFQSQF
ncbi:MAG TPA: hypothetical protein VG860_21645 [Terriglobia bacterium]|jgi:hypothetical protein|nr:hypothetical protein [Terriglobia bacterium]